MIFRQIFLVLLANVLFSCVSRADGVFLNAYERAYLYHVVVKSATLDRNIGHLFKYKGEVPKNKDRIDYDSLEHMIAREPTLLEIDHDELRRMPPGILAEASMKLALWKLNKELKDPEKGEQSSKSWEFVRKFVFDNAPFGILRKKGGDYELIPDIDPVFHPGLPAGEKAGAMRRIKDLRFAEMANVLNFYSQAVQTLAKEEAIRLYKILGGNYARLECTLIAAGEGSGTAGLLEEVEKQPKGAKPEKKKPVGIGLFTYHYEEGFNEAQKKDVLVKRNPIVGFSDYTGGSATTFHLSIWGFNNFFQATVVIRNGDKTYHLFGSKFSNELSPDTTFGHGKTIFGHIKEMEEVVITKEEEKLFKKGGLLDRLNDAKMKKELSYTNTQKAENALYQPSIAGNKKKYKAAQTAYLDWTIRYEESVVKVRDATFAYKKQWHYVDYLKDVLYVMKTDLGVGVQQYVQYDSLYVFEDGSTFNSYTQDFEIARVNQSGDVNIRLISLGSKPMSQNVDEVQLFVGIHEKPKEERFEFGFSAVDLYESDQFKTPQLTAYSDNIDSLAAFISRVGPAFYFSLNGKGIGMMTDNKIVKAEGKAAIELKAYPGKSEADRVRTRDSEAFKNLRFTGVKVRNTFGLTFEIESFTDPVQSQIYAKPVLDSLGKLYPKVSQNEMLSAFRCFAMAEALVNQLTERIPMHANNDFKENARHVERLKFALENSYAHIGKTSVPYKVYVAAKGP